MNGATFAGTQIKADNHLLPGVGPSDPRELSVARRWSMWTSTAITRAPGARPFAEKGPRVEAAALSSRLELVFTEAVAIPAALFAAGLHDSGQHAASCLYSSTQPCCDT